MVELSAWDRIASVAVEWKPIARTRAHELVIAAIEDQILAGALAVGDPLPPERELAARLEVSRASVREAIRVLEGQGVVQAAVGSGRDAGTFIAAQPSAALTRFLRLHVALANFATDDVTDARIMLERESALLAGRAEGGGHLPALDDALERMAGAGEDRTAFADADTDFHVALAEAGGNRLIADMTIAIRASLRGPLLVLMERVADWSGLAARLEVQHRGIRDAVAGGDGDLAARLVEEHITWAYDQLPRG